MDAFESILTEKIEYWKNKLIDLSRRNNLISYRFTKSRSIQIESPTLEDIFKELNNKNKLRFFKKDEDDENTSKYWVATEDDQEINKKLYNIYLKAKEHFQELGINTCFIGIGMLYYKNTEWSDDFNKSPILLCPIEIDRLRSISKNHHRFELYPNYGDLHLNPAIKEKLSYEYALELNDIQENENPKEYINTIKKIIEPLSNWEVLDESYLDIFSYQKFIMYKDISRNSEHIRNSPLIRAYVGDREALHDQYSESFREKFDDSVDVDILKADSSQKKAIELAKAGVTFALQGPPGTGKSQTISNMISALIEQNKKILFVSQKKAALDVVLSRLNEVGLGRYCLNLHMYRGNKKEIISQFIKELETSPIIRDEYKRYSFKTYLNTQNDVNEYYKYLCQPNEVRSLSVYDVRGKISLLHEVPMVQIDLSNIINMENEEYHILLDKLDQVNSILEKIPDPLNNLYFNYKMDKNTILQKNNYKDRLDEIFRFIEFLQNYVEDLETNLKIKLTSLKNVSGFIRDHTQLQKMNPPSFLISNKFFETWKKIQVLLKHISIIEEIKSEISDSVKEDFLYDDIDNFKLIIFNSSFISKFLSGDYKRAKKVLNSYSKKKISDSKWLELYVKRTNYLKSYYYIEEIKNNSYHLLNELDVLNIDDLSNLNDICIHINNIIINFNLNDNFYNVINYMHNNQTIFEKFEIFIKNCLTLQDYFENIILFNDELSVNDYNLNINNLIDDFEDIEDVLLFKQIYEFFTEEIKLFIQRYFDDEINFSIKDVFEKTYSIFVLDLYEKKEKQFTPKNKISILREKDKEVRNVKRFKVMEKVESNQPKYVLTSTSLSEVNILRREHKKKRRLLPIRTLLQKISDIAFILKPCFMMSPLSVSQYIEYGGIHFDVVIFDEASQIMPEDAVPCLLRSDQAVIMGDTQQLPPTSFFMKDMEDEDVDEDIIDLDSFLTEASLKFREESLNWHYRSKNENLISFSNYFFYDNRLITFPNSKEYDLSGIEFVYVENGIYDRGKSRTNRIEAKKVVEVFKKYKIEHPNKSIGIIAFSRAQEKAIREQFEMERIDIESSIDETEKSLFIKNLETVQGDERDIIIISVGYGPDAHGRFSYNFGPINKEGGYKRLNVAITRSRYITVVISSIDPSIMDEDRINSDGVRFLKYYLQYAKSKQLPVPTRTLEGLSFDSDFEEAVYDALINEGFSMSTQVGYSGYKIDLAIKHPNRLGEYILGIECDGSQYHSSKYARDRDKVRQEVLESLGWNIHRIWSDDWLNNREVEIDKIKTKVHNLLIMNYNIERIDETYEEVEDMKTISEFDPSSLFPKYKVANLPRSKINLEFDSYGRLQSSYYLTKIEDIMLQILEIESPMTRELLYKRTNTILSIGRIGTRIRRLYNGILRTLSRRNQVYIHNDTVALKEIEKLVPIRISVEKERPFLLIPIEELANASLELLKNSGSMPMAALIKDVAKFFYSNNRTGKKITNKMNDVVKHLNSYNLVEINNGIISIKK